MESRELKEWIAKMDAVSYTGACSPEMRRAVREFRTECDLGYNYKRMMEGEMPGPGWDDALKMYDFDKESLKAGLRASKDPERSNLFQLWEANVRRVFPVDESGEQMLRCLKFIEEAGGKVLQNQVVFLRMHLPNMPAIARERIKPITDRIHFGCLDEFAARSPIKLEDLWKEPAKEVKTIAGEIDDFPDDF